MISLRIRRIRAACEHCNSPDRLTLFMVAPRGVPPVGRFAEYMFVCRKVECRETVRLCYLPCEGREARLLGRRVLAGSWPAILGHWQTVPLPGRRAATTGNFSLKKRVTAMTGFGVTAAATEAKA